MMNEIKYYLGNNIGIFTEKPTPLKALYRLRDGKLECYDYASINMDTGRVSKIWVICDPLKFEEYGLKEITQQEAFIELL